MGTCRPLGHVPRETGGSDLVLLVREHLPAFLEQCESTGSSLPKFVVSELEGLLRCGDFEHGFLRFHCRRCGDELRVPFSCKARGVCPSCIGRRMAEGAAGWVDHLLPPVVYRQWVLSFRSSLAVRLGYDVTSLSLLCRSFARHITRHIRHAVKRHHGLSTVQDLHAGMVTVVQRFRADLGLYTHLHGLATDGAFALDAEGDVVFRPIPPLTDDDLMAVLSAVHRDLARAGILDDEELDIDPALHACAQLSLSTAAAPAVQVATEPTLEVSAFDMSLHAATCVDGRDRKRLERVCRYLLRPAFAQGSVHRLPDGRVRLDMPRRGRSILMTAMEFLGKLVALVPPPRAHLVRYCGVFANRHHMRPLVAPSPPSTAEPTPPVQLSLLDTVGGPAWPAAPETNSTTTTTAATPSPRRGLSWARLLARVFSIDVTTCPCGGRLKLTAAVLTPQDIALHLHGARAPPQPSPTGQLSLLSA